MADATDWTKLRDAAYRITCITRTANFGESDDEVVAWGLLGIIPADPNKNADAKWLKERGWTRIGTSNSWRSRCGGFMMGPSGCYDFVLYGDGRTLAGDPTRMTVALFEAAAMEAMKHGE